MLRVVAVIPLKGRSVRITLSDGTQIERDLSDLLDGPVFVRIAEEDAVFRQVRAIDGTLVWPGDVDIAPEALIWDGPTPEDASVRRPEPFWRPQSPTRARS